MSDAPTTWNIILPDVPMSMNGGYRTHWATRHKEKLALADLVWEFFQSAEVTKANYRRRAVQVHVHKGPRGRLDDPANLDGRAKGLLDAMVTTGYLQDDSHKWLDWRHVTQSTGQPAWKHTSITISEVSE